VQFFALLWTPRLHVCQFGSREPGPDEVEGNLLFLYTGCGAREGTERKKRPLIGAEPGLDRFSYCYFCGVASLCLSMVMS